ncbi:MAG: branched-chain amino acid ABC transporter permease [Parvibaculaceae bacterium]
MMLLAQLVNGISIGAIYAIVAAGLALSVGVLRVVNFSHGDLFMLGSYLFWFLYVQASLPYVMAGVLTIPLMALLGVVFFLVIIRPVLDKSWHIQLIATLAAATIINNGVIWVLGNVPQSAPTPWSQTSVTLFGVRLSEQRVAILVILPVVFVGLHYFLKYTRLGMAMRAVSQNREAARTAGIATKTIGIATFALGTALIGLGNILITPVYTVFPAMGMTLTMKGFAVMVVGGFGRVNGTVLAAFLLGIAEAFGIGYFGASFTDAFAFIAMIIVLLVSPHGIFGRKVGI